ncbi:hypothetical protein M422DRAFT_41183 [Sphaerobolus stellatus SS14]|nr:hypothetical protein M422DRAFT_41183 [Sphaerobolus stellatus SS14]
MASYQALPRDEPVYVRPAVYYNDGPFSPPSSVDGDDGPEKDRLDIDDERAPLRSPNEEGFPLSSKGKPFSPTRYLALSLAALVTLALGIGLFTAFSYPKHPSASGSLLAKSRLHITLDHIYNGTFNVERKWVNWVKEGKYEIGYFTVSFGSGLR